MGPGPGWHLRLCAPGREALAHPERRPDRDRSDLDPLVLDHQAQEPPVRLTVPIPCAVKTERLTSVLLLAYSLAAVNFFLGGVGIVQVSRILMWQQSQKGLPEAVEQVKEEVKEEAKEVKKAVKV